MIQLLQKLKLKLKLKFWLVLGLEIIVAIGIFTALSAWQERDMLASNSNAPVLSAMSLDGETYRFPETANSSKRTLVYFFAPWCSVCHLSIGNLNILRSQINEEDLKIIIVALDWTTKQEIDEYMAEHELAFPVLLGDQSWQEQYKIKGFPSYYLLNDQGEILSKSMGYSTALGMLTRAMMD